MCSHTVPMLQFSSLLFYLDLMKIWNPVAYSVSIYGSLYCFASFLYMQGVSFFYLFVCSSRRNRMILSLLGQGLYPDLRLQQVLAPEVRLLIQCTWDLIQMFLATFHRQRRSRALMSYQTATLRVTTSKCVQPFQKLDPTSHWICQVALSFPNSLVAK